LHVDITPGQVEYHLEGDEPLTVTHASGDRADDVIVRPGKPVTRKWRPVKPRTRRPAQPVGREPRSLPDA
jgi:hypothetical protein